MKSYKFSFILLVILTAHISIWAMPPKQGIRTIIEPDGKTLNIKVLGDGYLHFTVTDDNRLITLDSDGFYRLGEIDDEGNLVSKGIRPCEETRGKLIEKFDGSALNKIRSRKLRRMPPQSGLGLYSHGYPTEGSPKCLVILVEFSDVKFSDTYDVEGYFNEMINGDNFTAYGSTGSALQYLKDQSKGKFTPEFDIYGPVTLPETQAYYGGNYGQGWDVFAGKMYSDAATILDPEVDFKQYDEDGDGDVDFAYIFYAGLGEHDHGDENCIWPHAGKLKINGNFKKVDGVFLNSYACSNEMDLDVPAGMGPFIHEYSHLLGLPDLYTTDMTETDRDFSPGEYSVMDYGVYNNEGRTPPNFTAYERNALGWDEPIMLDHPMTVELSDISSGEFGLIPTSSVNEFFLLENRQLSGWDAYLPNHGMLIWHIDYDKTIFENNEVNVDRQHQRVDLVEANNLPGFLNYSEGFTFPGTSGNTSFTAETIPALVTWAGEAIDFPINDIVEEEGTIKFNVSGGDKNESGNEEDSLVNNICSEKWVTTGVYSSTGQLIKKNISGIDDLKNLPKGIYIVGKRKVIL